MNRILAAFLLAIAATVAGAAPAAAKCCDLTGVTIDGPGMEAPLILDREQFGRPRSQYSPEARVWTSAFTGLRDQTRPTGYLGPSYRITYRFLFFYPARARFSTHEDLYPFAAGGPVAHRPAQTYSVRQEHEVSDGWHPYPRVMVERFQKYGLPTEPVPVERPNPALPVALAVAALLLSVVQSVRSGRVSAGRGQLQRGPRLATRQV